MAFPRRIKDVSPVKGDSEPETEETPNYKYERRSQIMLPKRVAEFTPLKSDSDEEEYNNLNCARRLTNSDFSPTASDNESPKKLPDTPPVLAAADTKKPERNENNRNELNSKPPDLVQTSALPQQISAINIKNNDTRSDKPTAPSVIAATANRPTYRQIMPSSRFQQAFTEIVQPKNGLSIFKNIQPAASSSSAQNHIPFNVNTKIIPPIPSSNISSATVCPPTSIKLKPIDEVAPVVASSEETPLKPNGVSFKTPSIEYTSQRPKASSRFGSTNSISKKDLNNEFQSKKIVFTTPSTVTCRPKNFPSDASIDLSVNDTVSGIDPLPLTTSPLRLPALDLYSSGGSASPSPENVLHINGKRFFIEKKIGAGASSSVFLTKSSESKELVAVKVVDLQGDPANVNGYINETKLLAKLQGDDSVIRLFEYSHVPSENMLYMVMERGDTDLHNVLQAHGGHRLPLYSIMLYWHQMLNGVAYIHRNGVIHSDLKPANFLLVNGRLKLIDFGIASSIAVDSTSIIKFSQAGTFNYISPEALIDTSTGNSPTSKANQPKIKISTKSDVWSLGCILYLFLYNKTPFAHIKNICTKALAITNPNSEVAYGDLPEFYPAIYLKVLQRCLVFDPKKRASVQELLESPYDLIAPHHRTTTSSAS